MSETPLRPFGVSLAEIRESLHFEAIHGRGPDCPARVEMEKRAREHDEARPRNTKSWGKR